MNPDMRSKRRMPFRWTPRLVKEVSLLFTPVQLNQHEEQSAVDLKNPLRERGDVTLKCQQATE